MRLVFDTNVLFAAHITHGTCAPLYQEALVAATLLSSDHILNELEEKLVSKARMIPEEAARTRAEVAADCAVVTISPRPRPVCRDSDDDAILATAIAARADILVTGDKDLARICGGDVSRLALMRTLLAGVVTRNAARSWLRT